MAQKNDKFRWKDGDVKIYSPEEWEKKQAVKRNAPVKKPTAAKTGKKK